MTYLGLETSYDPLRMHALSLHDYRKNVGETVRWGSYYQPTGDSAGAAVMGKADRCGA